MARFNRPSLARAWLRSRLPCRFCPCGSSARLRLHPIRVVIGQPYLPSLPADKTEKPSYQLVAQEMMERIAALR